MVLSIVKAEETEDGVRVRVRVNNETKYLVKKFNNYFYVQDYDYFDNKHLISLYCSAVEEIYDHNDNIFYKLILKKNYYRNKLRSELEDNGVVTYEADITSDKRFFLEYEKSYHHDKLKYAFYDIETYDLLGFDKDNKGNIKASFPILSIAIKKFCKEKDGEEEYFYNEGLNEGFEEYKSLMKKMIDLEYEKEKINDFLMEAYKKNFYDEQKKYEEEEKLLNESLKKIKSLLKKYDDKVFQALVKGEKELLKKFYESVKKYDVISGWNSNGFDDIFIRERGKLHNIDFDNLMFVMLDYYLMYKGNNFDPVKSFKLNDIAYKELKKLINDDSNELKNISEVTKLDWRKTTKARKYFHLFLLYPSVHKEYNLQDVRILDMLEKELNFFKLHAMQTDLTKCNLNDTLYNSRMCDNDLLKSFKKKNIFLVSKPTQEEKELRELDKNSGGYTFCFLPGLHENVMCYDFKAHYLNVIRSFNISSENFLREEKPDLKKVFNNEEIKYISWCEEIAKEHLGSDGKIKPSYDKVVEKKAVEMGVKNMEDLMWFFIKNYDQKIIINEQETYTPSEINKNTFGWKVQPHRVFSKSERGVLPKILDNVSEERDSLKKEMKKYAKDSLKYRDYNIKQLAVKKIGNSHYGNFLYRGSRYYKQEVGNAITTTARYITKLCMLEIWDNGMKITHGDSVSGDSQIILENTSKNIEALWDSNNNKIIKRGDKEIKIWDEKKILTCNNELQNVFSKPTMIIRHKVNKNLYRIELFSGEKIDVTEDHSLIGLNKNNEFVEIKPCDVKKVLFNAKKNFVGKTKGFVEKKVFKITKLRSQSVYVYDLSVPKYEKFYANGFLVHNTDSSYCVGDKTIAEMDAMFKNMLDDKLSVFNLIGVGGKKHSVQFDFEKRYKFIIPIKKKRYYYMTDEGFIGGKGGSQTRSDVLKMGKDLQMELLKDIFNGVFDKFKWHDKLLFIKNKVYDGLLEEEHLIKVQGLAKDISEYGKPIIDKKTGFQKKTKGGKLCFANIPAHVKMAQEMVANGELVSVGDKIPFIVLKNKPIVPISVKQYRLTKKYDKAYYHEAIVKPVLEILLTVYPDLVYSFFKDCWFFSESQLDKLRNELLSGDD